jgi:hypothetical protein
LHRQAGKALPLIATTNPAGTSRGSHCCGSSSHGSTRSTRSRGSVCRSSGADMPNVSRQPPQRQCKLHCPRRLPASSRAAMCRLPGSQRWACPADSPCRMLWRHVHLTALACCTNTLKSNLPCCRNVLPERQPSANGCANRMPRQGGLPGSVHCRRSSSRRWSSRRHRPGISSGRLGVQPRAAPTCSDCASGSPAGRWGRRGSRGCQSGPRQRDRCPRCCPSSQSSSHKPCSHSKPGRRHRHVLLALLTARMHSHVPPPPSSWKRELSRSGSRQIRRRRSISCKHR